jgi:hypothetical protein
LRDLAPAQNQIALVHPALAPELEVEHQRPAFVQVEQAHGAHLRREEIDAFNLKILVLA